MNDPRINNNYLGIMDDTDYAKPDASDGVSEGCPSDSCAGDPCPLPFVCVDLWRKYECRYVDKLKPILRVYSCNSILTVYEREG